eukprot:jgi/Picre1/34372/NNA_001842.t1
MAGVDVDSSGHASEHQTQIEVKFTTKLREPYKVSTDGSITVPAQVTRYGLSQVVNHLLDLDRPIPFEFIVCGDVLCSTLGAHISSRNVTAEKVLEVEYVPAMLPPSPGEDIAQDDWLSCISESDSVIYTGSYDGLVRMWNSDGDELAQFAAHPCPVKSCLTIPGHGQLLTTGDDGSVRMWKCDQGNQDLLAQLTGHESTVESCAVRPDGERCATAGWDTNILIWRSGESLETHVSENPAKKQPGKKTMKSSSSEVESVGALEAHSQCVSDMVWKSHENLISCSWDHSIKFWDVEMETVTDSFTHNKVLYCLDTSNSDDSSHVVAFGGQKRPFDSGTGGKSREPLRNPCVHCNHIRHGCLILSGTQHQSTTSMTASYDGSVKLWDIRGEIPLHTIHPTTVSDDDRLLCYEYSKDDGGHFVACSSRTSCGLRTRMVVTAQKGDKDQKSYVPSLAAFAAMTGLLGNVNPSLAADFVPPPTEGNTATIESNKAANEFGGMAAAPAVQSSTSELPEGNQWRYSDFIGAVQNGKVERVRFSKDGSQLQLTAVDGRRALVVLPNDPELVDILAKNGVDISVAEAEQQGNYVSLLGNLLFPLVAFAGLFLLFRRSGDQQGGGPMGPMGGPMDFGRSKSKFQEIPETGVKFADKIHQVGCQIPKGALLVGPPGTGKTLIAKAVAGEAGTPFFSCAASEFVELFVGVGASRVRDLFEKAKAKAPCIIFIDEIDAVGRQRGAGMGGGNDEREQTINQLLTEMDGFEGNTGVIVLAATNRPDVLDSALLRPGRFDRQVTVDRPDVQGRVAILKVHSAGKTLAKDVDFDKVARRTPGFTGADLANLMNEAAILAARRNLTEITNEEIADALERIIAGPEKKGAVMSEAKKRLVAYHEAGHAVVGALMPEYDPVTKISIVPRGAAGGLTFFAPSEERLESGLYSRSYLENQMAVAMGGRVAEELIFGPEDVTTGASGDFQQVSRVARMMVSQMGSQKSWDRWPGAAVGETSS